MKGSGRPPGILATAHREHRRKTGPSVPAVTAHDRCLGVAPHYLTGPRAGQELADARQDFDTTSSARRKYLTRP